MGWGCYKHEMDAGSEAWQGKVDELSEKMLKEGRSPDGELTWGRDGEVCPFCWEEMEHTVKMAADSVDHGMTAECSCCGKAATCVGAYEGQQYLSFGCDNCCGHGNEDGHCWQIENYDN